MTLRSEAYKKLSWWLNFVQTDYESLSEQEKRHIAVDFYFYFSDWVRATKRDDNWLPSTEAIQKVQRVGKNFFETVLQNFPRTGIIVLPPVTRVLTKKDDRFIIVNTPITKDQPPSSEPIPREDLIINELAELIRELPVNAIRRCPACNKLFLHPFKSKKLYCSSRCGVRLLSRKHRERLKRNPKKYRAYLERQREITRRYYEEKRKSELGSNIYIKKNGKRRA